MTEYIDRKEALNFPFANGIYDHDHANEHFISGCKSYREWLSQIPAADVVERKTGKWEEVEIKWLDDDPDLKIEAVASMRCPICERYHNEVYYYGDPRQMARFCGFCGAKMEENVG